MFYLIEQNSSKTKSLFVFFAVLFDQVAIDLFGVNAVMGTVSVTGSLLYMDGAVFELKLTARDDGSPPRAKHVTIYVCVNSSVSVYDLDAGYHSASSRLNHNLTIVVSVATVSGLITVGLITAIVLLRRQDCSIEGLHFCGCGGRGKAAASSSGKLTHSYNCRMEAMKV